MLRVLGVIAGIISVTILAWKGFNVQLGPLLESALRSYEDQAAVFFRLIEPFITPLLGWLQAYVDWELKLLTHWKHAFLLMWLFFGASAKATWTVGFRAAAIFALIWGGAVALATGVMAGTIELASKTLVLWPIAGFALFGLGNALWAVTFERGAGNEWLAAFWLRGALGYATLGVLAYFGVLDIIARVLVPNLDTLPGPGLVVLAIFVAGLALVLLIAGFLRRPKPGTIHRLGLRDFDIHVALDMLAVIGGASFLVLMGSVTGI